MTPSPPIASIGSVQVSSPARTEKSAGRSRRIVAIWSMFADASFTATIRGMLGQPQESRGLDVHAGSAGDVVDDDRQVALVRDGPEVRLEHPLVGLVVVRRDDQGGVHAELRGAAGGPDRGRGAVRAGAGDDADARPRLGRSAATSRVVAITHSSSSWLSVGVSPVVPQATRPWMPASIWRRTRVRKVSSSIAPVGS